MHALAMASYVQYFVLHLRAARLVKATDLIFELLPVRTLTTWVESNASYEVQSEVNFALDRLSAIKAGLAREIAYIEEFFIFFSCRFILQEISSDSRISEGLRHDYFVLDDGCKHKKLWLGSRNSGRRPNVAATLRHRWWAVPVLVLCFMVSQDSNQCSQDNECNSSVMQRSWSL